MNDTVIGVLMGVCATILVLGLTGVLSFGGSDDTKPGDDGPPESSGTEASVESTSEKADRRDPDNSEKPAEHSESSPERRTETVEDAGGPEHSGESTKDEFNETVDWLTEEGEDDSTGTESSGSDGTSPAEDEGSDPGVDEELEDQLDELDDGEF